MPDKLAELKALVLCEPIAGAQDAYKAGFMDGREAMRREIVSLIAELEAARQPKAAPAARALDAAYRIITENAWGWPESGSDELGPDEQEHMEMLAVELDRFAAQLAAEAEAEWQRERERLRELYRGTQEKEFENAWRHLKEGPCKQQLRAEARVKTESTLTKAGEP